MEAAVPPKAKRQAGRRAEDRCSEEAAQKDALDMGYNLFEKLMALDSSGI